jgi:hypothetical protein
MESGGNSGAGIYQGLAITPTRNETDIKRLSVEDDLRSQQWKYAENFEALRVQNGSKDRRTTREICDDVAYPTPAEIERNADSSFFGGLMRAIRGDWEPAPRHNESKTWPEEPEFEENFLFGGGLWGIVHSLTGGDWQHHKDHRPSSRIRHGWDGRVVPDGPVPLEYAQLMTVEELYELAQRHHISASLDRTLHNAKDRHGKLIRMLQVSGVVLKPATPAPAVVRTKDELWRQCEQQLWQHLQSSVGPFSFDQLLHATSVPPTVLREVLASLVDRSILQQRVRQYRDQHTNANVNMDSWVFVPSSSWRRPATTTRPTSAPPVARHTKVNSMQQLHRGHPKPLWPVFLLPIHVFFG